MFCVCMKTFFMWWTVVWIEFFAFCVSYCSQSPQLIWCISLRLTQIFSIAEWNFYLLFKLFSFVLGSLMFIFSIILTLDYPDHSAHSPRVQIIKVWAYWLSQHSLWSHKCRGHHLTTPLVFLSVCAANACVTPTRETPSTLRIWSLTWILKNNKVRKDW